MFCLVAPVRFFIMTKKEAKIEYGIPDNIMSKREDAILLEALSYCCDVKATVKGKTNKFWSCPECGEKCRVYFTHK